MRIPRRLDAIDRSILHELSIDGRLTNLELAKRVGLTSAPCLRRVKRLEEEGVIRSYHARIDPEAADRGFEVFVSVEVSATDTNTLEEFEATVTAFDEVVEVRRLFGRPDYFLRVLVADHGSYAVFCTTKLGCLPAIRRIDSHQTMRVLKE
ncbi:Lrp/AsnC family transcriptional regulator [Rhodococcus koreensis]